MTDAEVFQEILHRYVVINRREAIQPVFDALLGMVDHNEPRKLSWGTSGSPPDTLSI